MNNEKASKFASFVVVILVNGANMLKLRYFDWLVISINKGGANGKAKTIIGNAIGISIWTT